MIEKIIKYLSVISIAIFLLGYSYLNGYYSSFHVNIVNYISTSEIFYALLPVVGLVFSIGYSLFQGYATPGPEKVYVLINDIVQKKQRIKITWIFLIIGSISIIAALINSTHFTYREAPLVQTFCLVIFIIGIGYNPVTSQQLKNIDQSAYLQFICFVLIGFLCLQFGQGKAKIIKTLGNDSQIKFKYHNTLYTTNDKLIYLGETQSTLLLYLKADSATWVLPKSNVDSLVILDK